LRVLAEAPVFRAALSFLVIGGARAAATRPVLAQQPAASATDSAAASEPDSLQLVFEREVFNYPQYERRNPFQPFTGVEVSGPRFEDVVLLGVVIQPNPQESVAVLGARPPGSTSDQPPTQTYRLRAGESLGNMRVIDIREREVLLEVGDFGVNETRRLTLRRPPPAPPFADSVPSGRREVAREPRPRDVDRRHARSLRRRAFPESWSRPGSG
jgi:hypothetical protein